MIEMPAESFEPGDPCWCHVHVDNFDGVTLTGNPLFVILDVFGELFFAPSFGSFDSYLSLHPSYPPGRTTIVVLPEFPWPADTGTITGINWFAGLTNPDMTALYGSFGTFTFGWDE